ncbi:MAG TPA: DoxX family protein [Thiolapillus brandeum]|uniref:DoxX family protein n=1 Tax=Thiolapillus brandeum TaxID=1076588 RepID=A0A831KBS1_9GAMM|nr:DoxX family protein [Thiolapillus brandeum]
MNLLQILGKPYNLIAGFLDLLSPIFDLAVRLWVAWAFFKSGLVKIQSWDSTLMLFEYEYDVPLLPPQLAAWAGTAAELSLPILVALGIASRLSAGVLFLFNAVAVYAYASFLFGSEGAAGLQQHILWGTMLLITVFHGPGKLSVDHLLCRKC